MAEVRKVLILSVKAGAGHIRTAAALEGAFRERHPGVSLKNTDALDYTNAAFQKSFIKGYSKLATDLPTVWEFVYDKFEEMPVDSKLKKLAALFDRVNSRPILKLAGEFDPDAIICTHYFPAETLAARRRRGRLRARLYVTLTDYDIHTMWIQPGVDHYFVATDEMAYALRAKGVEDAAVSVTGIPIMPVFAKRQADKHTLRKKLGLRPDRPTALVAAGGFGMIPVDKTVAALADSVGEAQFLALAGKNEKMHAALKAVAATRPDKVIPFGFVTNMHELMAASDLIITKCGGLTSSECLAMGLPMVIVNPIPGQEERNSDYLLENGVALRANSPAYLVYKVRKLLEHESLRARMSAAARRIARPRAAFDVADVVAGAS